MKHIIFDSDSTVGLPGKPMDDVLAFLYLLGRPEEAEILGFTCTFANGRSISPRPPCCGRSEERISPCWPGLTPGRIPAATLPGSLCRP